MLDSPQIFGVHNIGAVFIFERGHIFARTLCFLNQEYFVCRGTGTEGRLNVFHRNRFLLVDDITDHILFAFLDFIFPAAGIGAGTLVRVTFVDITGEQAAAGVGHAQCTVNKHFQLNFRYIFADIGDFFE